MKLKFKMGVLAAVVTGVVGCGGDDSSAPAVLTGTWKMNDVNEPMTLLVLLDDGRFVYAEGGGTAPNGLESGTYSYNSTAGTMTFIVTFDDNGAAGLGDATGTPLPMTVTGSTASITVGPDTYNWTKQTAGTAIDGTWLMTSPVTETFTTLILLGNDTSGDFIYAEADGPGPNGMQSGTYAVSGGTTIAFTITEELIGTGSGLDGVGSVSESYTSETLTLDSGTFVLARQ